MIVYLVTEQHSYTIRSFLETWGRALAPRFVVATYEAVLAGAKLPLGDAHYVFSDIDRIDAVPGFEGSARTRLATLHDKLVETCGADRVLNDPARTLQRFALLETLHAQGINGFRAIRASEDALPDRYPVFLREASGFESDALPLLDSPEAYHTARAAYQARGGRLDDALAVEFCATADADGITRKYGAFVLGGHIVARHLFFSRDWQVKLADLDEPRFVAEELAYLDSNPHAAALRDVCRLAGVGYGRIDYGLRDGRPQIWEINTNPMIASGISAQRPTRNSVHLKFVALFGDALAALEAGA